MATGGGTPEEDIVDHNLPNWSPESLEDRLNNMDWSGQKKANRSSEKNKKKFGMECEARLTNDISPVSSPGVGRRRTRTPHTYPHTRYMSQMSVPEQAELEKLKQKINFGDLDQRSIGSDSQGRATAANNKRQLSENRKSFNFLPLQLNTNKDKATTPSPPKRMSSVSSLPKDFLTSAFSKDLVHNFQASLSDDVRGEATIDSGQVVSRLVQIRKYISKASSMRDDLVEKNERSANVERLSNLIGHLKAQEKCYLKFLQKMLASENEEDIRTIDSAVGSGSVAESTSLNIDVQSEASDTTEVSLSRPFIEDNLESSQMKFSEFCNSTSSQSKGGIPAVNDRELWPCSTHLLQYGLQLKALDPQQEAKDDLKNMKKQHALLTRILQQQEQLRALKGRQAALLALQHKTEQAIAVMDDSVVTETTGSVSGLSLTSELNEELNDLIQRFHNQLHDIQSPPVPDNRRQAESLSLTREVSRSLNSSLSEPVLEDQTPLFSKVGVLLEKKQKMDSILGELHTLQDHHLNNTACSPQRGGDQRSISSAASVPQATDNRAPNSPAAAAAFPSAHSLNDSEDEENQNPAEKLKKLKEVRKRLNELRDLVRYYEQTSDMMTDAINENTKDDDEEETEDSWIESDQEVNLPVINIRNPQRSWRPVNSISNSHCGNNNRDERPLNTDCEINNRSSVNLRTFNVSSGLECLYNRESRDEQQHCNVDLDENDADDDQDSVVSLSSRSSVTEEVQTGEYEEKFSRLIAAKHKLKQLQDLIAMYDGDTDGESETNAPERSTSGRLSLPEVANPKQQPNNTRPNATKTQRDVALKEQTREKFYESKLQQQQKELQQLQEERRKLIEIQEKIQTLRKACPDLQVPPSFKSCPVARNVQTASSSPDVNVHSSAAIPSMPDPEDSSSVDNEVWSEIRWNQILREDLRQRRKQLESLMAEHQRRQGLTETTSAGSLRSDDSETHGFPHQSRTEKTMATWGGSTQCALDEDDEEDGCISDVNQVEDEEEEEQEETFHENVTYPQTSMNQSGCTGDNGKQSWKGQRPYAVDGNYRPSPRTKQQQNISMRRQENLRWVSELSQVEEKQFWQEQIDQIKRQLDFSTNMCQTLMRDQQSLYYLLQSSFANPYNLMPSSLGTSQTPLIMHQLNQCFTQLNCQQNNVLRLKQMLSDVMRQQQEPMQQNSQQRNPQESSAAPSASPNVFDQYTFLPPPMNVFGLPSFGNLPNMVPGVNFNPVFQPGMGDFTRTSTSQADVPLHPPDPNTSGKTEYMAFPKPFESNSSTAGDRQSTTPKVPEGEHNRDIQLENKSKEEEKKPFIMDPVNSAFRCSTKVSDTARVFKQFEESMDSLSSMPDPVDPTTVTKTFKSRKASAQASLASKDKTPKNKNKKRKISHQKNRGLKNLDLQSASASSITEPKENSSKHAQTEETGAGNPIYSEHLQRLRKDSKAADISSEAGSDFSMFEALRDTIYSEVATLISQNECRPHFLIELFHELQLLSTDYLRQKALFALQDIVARRMTENTEKKKHDCSKPLDSAGWMGSNSELTPSESLATTDDEMYAKNSNSQACNEGEQNDADNVSTLSTSSNFEPFATDDLGNTVIHLDQALARMREYERMKIEAESSLDAECCSKLNNAATNVEGSNDGENSKQCSDDGYAVPCPRIDSQQLNRQIKAIMKEVIPFLKEHMEEVCSPHLLTSIRRMVLTLTQQNDESKEFVKFFHKQLGSILQDSLEKFSNKKLKDCGEDLLVEISEVLFNELAFFRLMQDLDNNSSSVQSQHKSNNDVLQSFTKKAGIMSDGIESSDTRESDDEDKDKDETETLSKSQNKLIDVSEAHSGRSDISEEEDGNEIIPVSISLSKAETQALTNYGSGEDENEEEEENYEFEAHPVDVQTSLEASAETTEENEKEQTLKNPINETESENTAELCIHEAEEVQNVEGEQNPLIISAANISASLNLNKEGDMSATVDVDTKSSLASAESSGPGSPATDSPVLVNEYETGSGNLSQKSDEDDFVKLEDLPLKLASPKAELMAEMQKEQLNNNLYNEILTGQGNGADELAGDALLLKEPESTGAHSG